jgi:hypothetical protein
MHSPFEFILSKTILNLNNFLLVHNSSNPNQAVTLNHARGQLNFHYTNNGPTNIHILRWIKPPYQIFKLNTDATFSISSHSSYGGILRDHVGKMIFCYFGPTKSNSPLEAEFIATLIGCRICKIMNMDFSHLILETDNNSLVDSLISSNCTLFNHLNRWLELLNYVKNMHTIKHTYRETNAVADLLAKQGKTSGTFTLYFSKTMLNSLCRNLILLDIWSIPYIKLDVNI